MAVGLPRAESGGAALDGRPSPALHLIVPTRNSHQLLSRLVDSLRSQTLADWRLTFIDGDSDPVHCSWLEDLCRRDSRFQWCRQAGPQGGIYGAMNQGFRLADAGDWLLFWGSDDWAASSGVLAEVLAQLTQARQAGCEPDLLVCRGRYYRLRGAEPPLPGRSTAFRWCHNYRTSLWLGSTPPHQATLVGPGARRRLDHYAEGFRLSADLDYFLQLSADPRLAVARSPLELVHLGEGGVSGQQTSRRLQEVRRAYRRAFGGWWWCPFLLRYGQRLFSLLDRGKPA
jgi:glycosyltransferase involved in cell wall biosynthesis